MTRLIEHLVEPQRLLLFWQARESQMRSRFHVGQLVKQDGHVIFQYGEGPEMDSAIEAGFQGYPAFPLKEAMHRHQVMEAFARRLPPRTRRDFARYLELRAIPPDAEISDFALLGYSGAKLPDDGFELIHPFDKSPAVFEVLIEVAGFRHESELGISEVKSGDEVQFLEEPDNPFDADAIQVRGKGCKLGYVPRGHLDMLHRMLSDGAVLTGEVFRINGTSERPLVYVLTRVARSGSPAITNNSLGLQARG